MNSRVGAHTTQYKTRVSQKFIKLFEMRYINRYIVI